MNETIYRFVWRHTLRVITTWCDSINIINCVKKHFNRWQNTHAKECKNKCKIFCKTTKNYAKCLISVCTYERGYEISICGLMLLLFCFSSHRSLNIECLLKECLKDYSYEILCVSNVLCMKLNKTIAVLNGIYNFSQKFKKQFCSKQLFLLFYYYFIDI